MKTKNTIHFYAFISFVFLYACSPSYVKLAQQPAYDFTAKDGAPDYSDLDFWAAHPDKRDPSDSVPKPLCCQPNQQLADVFFLHPTTFTNPAYADQWNARLDDRELNAKTDYKSILYQASAFNEQTRVFAPRYRQAHLLSFYSEDSMRAKQAFELAYEDIKNAFNYYLNHFYDGRPIIIAAHSQGTMHAARLLRNYFEGRPLQDKLVVAYLVGMPLPVNYFSTLKPCEEPEATGCYVGWRTFRRGFIPEHIQNEQVDSYVTNPLTWKITEDYAPAGLNKGAVLFKFHKVKKELTDAQIQGNVLWVAKPKFPMNLIIKRKNLHVGDINIFYANVRENVNTRINAFLKGK